MLPPIEGGASGETLLFAVELLSASVVGTLVSLPLSPGFPRDLSLPRNLLPPVFSLFPLPPCEEASTAGALVPNDEKIEGATGESPLIPTLFFLFFLFFFPQLPLRSSQ
jgi:hypothetical protein